MMAFDQDIEERTMLTSELERLRAEHRELDAEILVLERSGLTFQLQLQRLKKRKLTLKDRMAYLEDQLTPDIIA